jgi:(R,R)-butanediol dehydrogenase/meso-butanediol dehydrogenase/diacetyl reductase
MRARRRIGVEHLIDPTTQDVAAEVRALSGGSGADVAIDCAGAPVAFPSAMQALGFNGRMVIVAAYEKPIELNPMLLMGNKTIRTSIVYTPADFQGVLNGMAVGNYTTEGGWITEVPLDQAESAIQQLRQGAGMKILVNASAD